MSVGRLEVGIHRELRLDALLADGLIAADSRISHKHEEKERNVQVCAAFIYALEVVILVVAVPSGF